MYWLVFPLTALLIGPIWVKDAWVADGSAYGDTMTTGPAYQEGGGGIPPTYAEGGGGIPPTYAEGGGGIPPTYAEGGGGIPPT